MLYLEFDTEQEAELCLHMIDYLAVSFWSNQDYTVVYNPETGLHELIGKRSDTDQNNPNAQRTVTWSKIFNLDSKFYIVAPHSDARFVNWRNLMPEGINTGRDIEMEPDVFVPQNDE